MTAAHHCLPMAHQLDQDECCIRLPVESLLWWRAGDAAVRPVGGESPQGGCEDARPRLRPLVRPRLEASPGPSFRVCITNPE
jgi:hypothetical protein